LQNQAKDFKNDLKNENRIQLWQFKKKEEKKERRNLNKIKKKKRRIYSCIQAICESDFSSFSSFCWSHEVFLNVKKNKSEVRMSNVSLSLSLPHMYSIFLFLSPSCTLSLPPSLSPPVCLLLMNIWTVLTYFSNSSCLKNEI